jgi:hypothetical protein
MLKTTLLILFQAVGFGTWQATADEVRQAVITALKVGHRYLDLAKVYQVIRLQFSRADQHSHPLALSPEPRPYRRGHRRFWRAQVVSVRDEQAVEYIA